MAVLSINDQIDRVRAIMALYSGIGTDVTLGVDLVSTPAYEVYVRPDSLAPVAARQSLIALTLVIRIYGGLNDDPNDDLKQRVAIRAANAYPIAMMRHLRQYPNFMLPGVDAGLMIWNGDMTPRGPFPVPYQTHLYAGFELEFSVTTTA